MRSGNQLAGRWTQPFPYDHYVSTTRPVWVFVDESGNLDFSAKGTNHFVMTAVMTDDPSANARALTDLKYEFLSRGLGDQVPFHATTNSLGTRRRVAGEIGKNTNFGTHTIWADKHYTHPSYQNPVDFYALFGRALAKYLLALISPSYDPIVIVFDAALTAKQRGAFMKTVKPALNKLGRTYHIMFKPVTEDVNGQIADYYAWAMFRKLESGDDSMLTALPGGGGEFNLFRHGFARWY